MLVRQCGLWPMPPEAHRILAELEALSGVEVEPLGRPRMLSGCGKPYWALTAAISCCRPCLASAKNIPVLGFTYKGLSTPA